MGGEGGHVKIWEMNNRISAIGFRQSAIGNRVRKVLRRRSCVGPFPEAVDKVGAGGGGVTELVIVLFVRCEGHGRRLSNTPKQMKVIGSSW